MSEQRVGTPPITFTAGSLLDEAGRAAGRIIASRDPRRGASLASYRDIAAMAELIHQIGMSIPPLKAASKPVQTSKKGGL